MDPKRVFQETLNRITDAFPDVDFKLVGEGTIGGDIGRFFSFLVMVEKDKSLAKREPDQLIVRLQAVGSGLYMTNPVRFDNPDWSDLERWFLTVRKFLEEEARPLRRAATTPDLESSQRLVSYGDLLSRSGVTWIIGGPQSGKSALLEQIVMSSGAKNVLSITDDLITFQPAGEDGVLLSLMGYTGQSFEEVYQEVIRRVDLFTVDLRVLPPEFNNVEALHFWAVERGFPILGTYRVARPDCANPKQWSHGMTQNPLRDLNGAIFTHTSNTTYPIEVLKHRFLVPGSYRKPWAPADI